MKRLFCEFTGLKRRVKLDADLIDRKFSCGKKDLRRGQKKERGRNKKSDGGGKPGMHRAGESVSPT